MRVERAKETGDPILPVADAIAAEARLIAFDEMIVTNSADAMILSRLFTRIIDQGVIVVATSNSAAGGSLQERAQPRTFSAIHASLGSARCAHPGRAN